MPARQPVFKIARVIEHVYAETRDRARFRLPACSISDLISLFLFLSDGRRHRETRQLRSTTRLRIKEEDALIFVTNPARAFLGARASASVSDVSLDSFTSRRAPRLDRSI